jgi:DNA-binding CsgD family transcriptional regulator
MDAQGAERLVVVTVHPASGDALIHVLERGLCWLPPRPLLEQLFQLTPAESRVALAIAEGKNPRALAEELDISLNTARVHVQRVLSKTSSPRQAELALLVVQLGALTVWAEGPNSPWGRTEELSEAPASAGDASSLHAATTPRGTGERSTLSRLRRPRRQRGVACSCSRPARRGQLRTHSAQRDRG